MIKLETDRYAERWQIPVFLSSCFHRSHRSVRPRNSVFLWATAQRRARLWARSLSTKCDHWAKGNRKWQGFSRQTEHEDAVFASFLIIWEMLYWRTEEYTDPEATEAGATTWVRRDGLVVSTTNSLTLVRGDPAWSKYTGNVELVIMIKYHESVRNYYYQCRISVPPLGTEKSLSQGTARIQTRKTPLCERLYH